MWLETTTWWMTQWVAACTAYGKTSEYLSVTCKWSVTRTSKWFRLYVSQILFPLMATWYGKLHVVWNVFILHLLDVRESYGNHIPKKFRVTCGVQKTGYRGIGGVFIVYVMCLRVLCVRFLSPSSRNRTLFRTLIRTPLLYGLHAERCNFYRTVWCTACCGLRPDLNIWTSQVLHYLHTRCPVPIHS
jgi:hypothetical protein